MTRRTGARAFERLDLTTGRHLTARRPSLGSRHMPRMLRVLRVLHLFHLLRMLNLLYILLRGFGDYMKEDSRKKRYSCSRKGYFPPPIYIYLINEVHAVHVINKALLKFFCSPFHLLPILSFDFFLCPLDNSVSWIFARIIMKYKLKISDLDCNFVFSATTISIN